MEAPDASDKFADFGQFYPEDISLNGNVDGLVMVELLQEPAIQNWLVEKTGIEFAEKMTTDQMCKLARAVLTLKCRWGFLAFIANPLCHVAFGVTVACLISALFD